MTWGYVELKNATKGGTASSPPPNICLNSTGCVSHTPIRTTKLKGLGRRIRLTRAGTFRTCHAAGRDMPDLAGPGKEESMSLGARDYCAVLSRFATVISLAASACLAATDATAQWYVGVDIGGNASRDIVVKSRSNDRPSICKEYINPRALSVADCTTPGRGAGDGWLAPFDPDAGFFGEAELGCHLSPRWRLAAVYARSPADFNQTVSSTDATGADFDKIRSSLSGSARARARSGRGTLRPPWPATRTWTRS